MLLVYKRQTKMCGTLKKIYFLKSNQSSLISLNLMYMGPCGIVIMVF
jgi:hypothetical protein